MCLIIHRKKDTPVIDKAFFEDVHSSNKDGWGIMWRKFNSSGVCTEVKTKKGLEFKDFWKLYRTLESSDIEMLVHFRMRTDGDVNLDMCHPFKIIDGVYMMHNGIIDYPYQEPDLTKSDTWCFIDQVLIDQIKLEPKIIRTEGFMFGMETICGSGSTLAFMDKDGIVIANTDRWKDTEFDVPVSNTYAYRYGNPTKAYGNDYKTYEDDDDGLVESYEFGYSSKWGSSYNRHKSVYTPPVRTLEQRRKYADSQGFYLGGAPHHIWIIKDQAVLGSDGEWMKKADMEILLANAGAVWDDLDDEYPGHVMSGNCVPIPIEKAVFCSDGEFWHADDVISPLPDDVQKEESVEESRKEEEEEEPVINAASNVDWGESDPYDSYDAKFSLSQTDKEYLIFQFQTNPPDIRNFAQSGNVDAITDMLEYLLAY
jgi:hypothetical protein